MKIAILHPSSVDSLAPFRDLDPPRVPDHYLPGHDYVNFQIRKASAVRQVVEIARMGFDAAIEFPQHARSSTRHHARALARQSAVFRPGLSVYRHARSDNPPPASAVSIVPDRLSWVGQRATVSRPRHDLCVFISRRVRPMAR